MLDFDQSLSRVFDLLHKGLESTFGINKNWGRWSDMVAVMFPKTASLENTFTKILPMKVLEWLVRLVGCKVFGIREFKAREPKYLLVDWSSLYFSKLTLKSPRTKILFFFLRSYQVVH